MTHRRMKGRFILLFLLLFLTGCNMSPGGEMIEQTDYEYAATDLKEESASEQIGNSTDIIWVHVSGQVKNPGVYSFCEGSRVFDAVEAAGGFTEIADLDSINLAMSLIDEGKIYIGSLKEGDESTNSEQSQPDGRINVNRATLEELMTLPGIGEKRAESILKLREKKGSFQTVEELLEAEGIKEGIFEQIKDFIKV